MKTQLIPTADNIHQKALQSLVNGQQLLSKSYLTTLGNNNILLLDKTISYATDVRLFKLERLVVENKQSVLESLTAAYTALGTTGYTVFLLLKSDGRVTDLYLGVKGKAKQVMGSEAGKLLKQVFQGHFSGSCIQDCANSQTEKLFLDLKQINSDVPPSVTAVTGVPSLSIKEREHFIQGLEHFIDAAEGKVYQALILADPVSSEQLEQVKRGYEGVATQLSPLLKQSLSYGENDSESIGLSLNESIAKSLGTSLSQTETQGENESSTTTTGTSFSKSTQTTTSINYNVNYSTSFSFLGFSIGETHGLSTGKTFGQTESNSTSNSEGRTVGTQSSSSSTQGNTQTDTHTSGKTQSINKTEGSTRQITFEAVDKGIEQLLKQVDHQLERIAETHSYGGWNTAAYFIGDSSVSSKALASIFLGLMRGDNSNRENYALTTWKSEESRKILNWLINLQHPRLNIPFARELGINYLTPATLVSTKEMAMQLSLPRRSTSTVTVVESQAFGHQVQNVNNEQINYKRSIELGCIRHLWTDLTMQKIELDIDKLSSHLFVTGSTGSGKSNTIYTLLAQLKNKHHIPFMVIEPAKGEYKHIFGNDCDVKVLGTNPKLTDLLKINPFKFPLNIHILEHIDRLVEIFNACWPMYAAMPAVLKEAILLAYQKCGWDLDTSENTLDYMPITFPTFTDLLVCLESVINNSAYSDEIKSNYIGSLVTRVKSLTNGLNGHIFSHQEIDNSILFDQSVIIDLSRIGSQETKSLIMGILIMRLNEHRMAYSTEMNTPLKHITVLEEAHNILKRTSTEQNSEGANVAGKAVEMLSNAIAEMRTYGEGFIIADQSPNAVDISAIRNTNTKIVMRLPDETDRRLAGKASGVNDAQLEELAKLPKGVAVVYQNDWLEPILCRINHCQLEEKPYQNRPKERLLSKKTFYLNLTHLLLSKQIKLPEHFDLQQLKDGLNIFSFSNEIKKHLWELINEFEKNGQLSFENSPNYIAEAVIRLTDVLGLTDAVKKKAHQVDNVDDLAYFTIQHLEQHLGVMSKNLKEAIRGSLPTKY